MIHRLVEVDAWGTREEFSDSAWRSPNLAVASDSAPAHALESRSHVAFTRLYFVELYSANLCYFLWIITPKVPMTLPKDTFSFAGTYILFFCVLWSWDRSTNSARVFCLPFAIAYWNHVLIIGPSIGLIQLDTGHCQQDAKCINLAILSNPRANVFG